MNNSTLNRPLSRCCTVTLLGSLLLSTGCAQVNLRQLAYEVLSQEDCRRNQLEDFCSRTFAREYLEYEQLRQEFIRAQTQRQWRVNRDETTLSRND